MRRFEKFKIWFAKGVDNVVQISETDKVNNELEKSKVKLGKLSDAYYKSEGKRKTLEVKIEKSEKTLIDIKFAAKKCKENNDDVNLNKLFVSKKNIEKNIQMYKETLKLSKEVSEDLYIRKTKMETYINELKHRLEQIQLKEDYSKQAEEFMKTVSETVDNDKINLSEEKVEIDFNASKLKVKDFDENESVEDIIDKYNEDLEFEKFKNEL